MPSPDPLTIADRALLSARLAWPAGDASRFWEAFSPVWRHVLIGASATAAPLGPEESRERLRLEHRAEARPDLARVHPSWWLRALKDETPAVQRAVVAGAPKSIREPLRSGLGLTADDLRPDHDPLAPALRAAAVLWAERLVGDWPARDDPPAIVAITRLDLRNVARLVRGAGLVKWALSGEDPPALSGRDRSRLLRFRQTFASPSPRLALQARHDVVKFGHARRHGLGSLGLLTVARLLDVAEPYRVRWALQHLPYPVARFTRTLMGPKAGREASMVPGETQVLRAAWDRLREEGRMREEMGGVA